MYEVAKQISDERIEVMAGKYLFRFRAQRVADSRNAAAPTLGAFFALAKGNGPRWEVWPSKALDAALDTASRMRTERERARIRGGVVVETVPAASVPLEKRQPGMALADMPLEEAKTLAEGVLAVREPVKWLDEDPTDHDGLRYAEPEDVTGDHDEVRTATEDQWDAAFWGPLDSGKAIPAIEIDPTAGMTPEDAEKAWAGVLTIPGTVTAEHGPVTRERDEFFTPASLSDLDIQTVDTGAELDALIGKDKAAAVRVFLDDDKPVTVARPARKTAAPKGERVPKRTAPAAGNE